MTMPILAAPVSPLRQRLIDDMNMRRFSRETQRNYIRDVGRFATFLGRPPDTATADDLRRFQVEQRDAGVPGADHEQHRVGAAVLLHPHARSAGPGAQAGPAGPSAQAARGAEPGRGRPAVERDHLPQAPGGAVGRLWRGPARRRGLGAEGRRCRQRAHAAPGRARQGRAVPQRHALGRSAHPAAPVVEGRAAAGRDASRWLAVPGPARA